jgi:hypothetical protein
MSSLLRRVAAPLLLSLFAAAGCSNYAYIEVQVKLDPATDIAISSRISLCHVFVSGANTEDFVLDPGKCPPLSRVGVDPFDMGKFRYNTFAESGDLTFTLKGYEKQGETPQCQLGMGAVTIPVHSSMTTSGVLTVKVMGPGCP